MGWGPAQSGGLESWPGGVWQRPAGPSAGVSAPCAVAESGRIASGPGNAPCPCFSWGAAAGGGGGGSPVPRCTCLNKHLCPHHFHLHSKASAVAAQLARLDDAMYPMLSRRPAAPISARDPLRAQLTAACFTLSVAAGIVSDGAVPAAELREAMGGCKLILRSGAAVLERDAAALRSRSSAGTIVPGSAGMTEGKALAEMAAFQLALNKGLAMASQAGQMEHFASQVAPPATLVRWLSAATQAFSAAGPGGRAPLCCTPETFKPLALSKTALGLLAWQGSASSVPCVGSTCQSKDATAIDAMSASCRPLVAPICAQATPTLALLPPYWTC